MAATLFGDEPIILRALSVKQPFAGLIMAAVKPVENRSWSTNYRGPLAIVASLRPDAPAMTGHQVEADEAGVDLSVTGAILGTVEIVDVVRDHRSRWAQPGCFHWILADARPLAEPIPLKGRLGLWTLDPALAEIIIG